jgi:hypothetical protein
VRRVHQEREAREPAYGGGALSHQGQLERSARELRARFRTTGKAAACAVEAQGDVLAVDLGLHLRAKVEPGVAFHLRTPPIAYEREHLAARPREQLDPVRPGNEHVATEPRTVNQDDVGELRGRDLTAHVERDVDGSWN